MSRLLTPPRACAQAGFVAGFSTNSPPPGTPSFSRFMLWNSEGDVVDWAYPIDNLTAFDPGGLNNQGEIVGTMLGPQQAFHFHDNVIRNLNHHFEQPTPGITLDLWDAYDINSSGQIVAQGQFVGGADWNNYGYILTPKPTCAPADLDCSGNVDLPDLLILLQAWGPCPNPRDCPADLSGDGTVGVEDLLMLLANWG